MIIRLLNQTCRRCGLVLLLIGLWFPPAAFGQAESLGEFLDAQGRLTIPEGYSGSLNPEGYEMTTAADGTPRFVTSGGGNVVPGQWEGFGGVNFGCNGSIVSMAIDASGLVYLGGVLTACGETAANSIVAYDPVAKDFHALGNGAQNGVNGSVSALAISGSDVFVGGKFTEAGGQSANHVARWDGSQWHALGSGVGGAPSYNWVAALAVSGSELYVGGAFAEAGGQQASNVARWDGSQWHALGSGVGGHSFLTVSALAVSGTDLYVGGFFQQAGSEPANHVARWDGGQWHALGSGINNGVSSQVDALAISGNDVYVGGAFAEAGGQPASHVARWDGSQWQALGSGVGGAPSNNRVSALIVSGSKLYIGGNFTEAGGQPANFVARWDDSQWHALGSGLQNGLNNRVDALAIVGNDVYLGGSFRQAGGQPASRVARWDGGQWHAPGGGGQKGLNDGADALAFSGSNLYVGGPFTEAGGEPANYIARWDGGQWHTLGNGAQNGVNSRVAALAVSGNDMYVGGYFTEAGGEPANHVAHWDGSQWHALGSGVGGAPYSNRVSALAISGNGLYVGGYFTEAGGQPASNVARWDGSQWHALGNGVGGEPYHSVSALAVSGTELYVGGNFTEAGGQPANKVARWDGSQWHALGSGVWADSSYAVSALVVSGNNVYVGGYFTEAGGQPASNVARWDGSQWHALGSGAQNGLNSSVYALAVSGNDVYVGGYFTEAGGEPANRVARWDGNQWASLGSGNENGINSSVHALAATSQVIHVGGSFSQAGTELSSGIATFVPEQPLHLSVTPATVLTGETSVVSVSGGFGTGAVNVELASGGAFCSLSGSTLSALAKGECTVTATKAADAENPEQTESVLVRVVTDPGVNLVVEVDQLPSVSQLSQAAGRSQCDGIGFRIQVSNNGPLVADQVQVQMPSPPGLLPPIDWSCAVAGGQCTPASGQGAVDTTFTLAVGDAAEIDLTACLDPNASFVDLRVQGSLPEGAPPLVFPNEARVNWYVPVNNNGLFRSRFE